MSDYPGDADQWGLKAQNVGEKFIHIPGPNPILSAGEAGTWDEGVLEVCDVVEDSGTYYLYYHATGQGKSYRIGVATAPQPLGPFTKHGDGPVLDLGPTGSWDDCWVACAAVLKVGVDRYYMWYSAKGGPPVPSKEVVSIGLATAPHPLGPWTKHEANPIIKDFGYVGGVANANGKLHLYTEHPIGSTGPDYGPFCLAVADHPEGPWTIWSGNPVLRQGG